MSIQELSETCCKKLFRLCPELATYLKECKPDATAGGTFVSMKEGDKSEEYSAFQLEHIGAHAVEPPGSHPDVHKFVLIHESGGGRENANFRFEFATNGVEVLPLRWKDKEINLDLKPLSLREKIAKGKGVLGAANKILRKTIEAGHLLSAPSPKAKEQSKSKGKAKVKAKEQSKSKGKAKVKAKEKSKGKGKAKVKAKEQSKRKDSSDMSALPALEQRSPTMEVLSGAKEEGKEKEIVSYDTKSGETSREYTGLERAYERFNRHLFGGELPGAFLVFSRKKGAVGYHSHEKLINRDGERMTEISLNPDHILNRSKEEVLSTLVHEMAHQRRWMQPNPPRPGYHDKQFSETMEELGLITSATGKSGGKRTGQKITHYIEEGGAFQKCVREMDTKNVLNWGSIAVAAAPRKKRASDKVKYSCSQCDTAAWGKPGLLILCAEHKVLLEEK